MSDIDDRSYRRCRIIRNWKRTSRDLLNQRSQLVDCSTLKGMQDAFDSKTSKRPRVLFLGDSVAIRVARDDCDRRDLIHSLGDALKGAGVVLASAAGSAYHAGVYEALVRAMVTMSSQPDVVIFPINMRSYSPQWFLNPKWQFEDIIGEARHFYEKGEELTVKGKIAGGVGYEEVQVRYPIVPITTICGFREWIERKPVTDVEAKERYKVIFIYHYLHQLVRENPRVHSTVSIITTLLAADIRVICYVTPINHVAAKHFVGSVFTDFFCRNIKTLTETIAFCAGDTERLLFFDWSRIFAPPMFFHENSPVEHLNEIGRRELCRILSLNVLQLLTTL